jgi:hypothetical protein
MPVILLQEDEEEWLNRDVIEQERLLQLLKQYQERDAILFQAIAPNTGQHERRAITRLHRFRATAPYCCSIRNSPLISNKNCCRRLHDLREGIADRGETHPINFVALWLYSSIIAYQEWGKRSNGR